ncbi:unnamed protein product [Ectocarpus sp. CCAP 1310/34]|nr:unnamed protein product [Ectocarpus sp. CCAP 1310/34]
MRSLRDVWPLSRLALAACVTLNVGHTLPELSLSTPTCWVFTHNNKAGGTTVKTHLRNYAESRNETVALCHSDWYARGDKGIQDLLNDKPVLIAGGYAEGLRTSAFQGCKWFTMMRHPIARLISAFYYCSGGNRDQLCAANIHKPEDGDIYDFAKHWGNYALLQFALGVVDQHEIFAEEVDAPAWFKAKLYFEGRLGYPGNMSTATNRTTHDEWQSVWIPDILQPVEELLRSNYAAVGILEHWQRSMMLFDHALEIPGFNWTVASASLSPRKSQNKIVEKKAMLAAAMTDPVLRQYVWLDLLLYEYACSLHEEQLRRYDLALD